MDTSHDTPHILLAKALATYLLRHSFDKQGEPLINHALRVHSLCLHLTEDQQIAAILHDCIEDGQLDSSYSGDQSTREYWIYSIIQKLFGYEVVGIVLSLTHYSRDVSYSQYIEIAGEDLGAIPVKLADLTDNLDPNRPIPDFLHQRYLSAKAYLESRLNNLSTN